jgi:C-terminal binding protein
MSSQAEVIGILEPEGLYADTSIENAIFATSLSQTPFKVYQANLPDDLPGSYADIPQDLRDSIHGLFVFRRWFTASDVPLFPNLRVVVRMGVGYDRLDRVALDKGGIIVCNCPGIYLIRFRYPSHIPQ